jgi:D-sedoheptulose 7-phosphate isomerase
MTVDAEFAKAFVEHNVAAVASLPVDGVLQAAQILDTARQHGRRVFVLGNGGSASTASHMACDLMKATSRQGRPPVRVHSLSDNVALMTAWANDESFDVIFEAQLRVHAESQDVLVAVSGSGQSPNVVRALTFARSAGLSTIGLLGMGGGPARELCDVAVVVESDNYEVIENGHLVVGHLFAAYLREHGEPAA